MCFLSSGDGYVGEFLELQQGCEGPFESSRGSVCLDSRRLSGNGPHLAWRGEPPVLSRVAAGALDIGRGTQGPALVASGKARPMRVALWPLGIPLLSMPWPRPCVESVPEPEDFSPVLTWILGYFWSLPRGVSPRLEGRHARALSSRAEAAVHASLREDQGICGFPSRLSHEAFPQVCPTCHSGESRSSA